MKLKELLEGIEVLDATADMEMEIPHVSYDSRATQPGDLFVAMTGFAADGHAFIGKAMAAGASAVLCQKQPEDPAVPYVRVADSRRALAEVGANFFGHPADSMTMVGVTGTNGKTTTTYLLKSILEQAAGAKVGLIGTNQNMIGEEIIPTERTTPESFELQRLFAQMRDAGCTHVVMEVSSHALTVVGACGTSGKTTTTCRLKSFLEQAAADLWAENVCLEADHVAFDAVTKEKSVPIRVNIPGGFMVYNTLDVLGAALMLGIPLEKSADVLARVPHVKGRVEVVPTPGKDYTVLIDYAHSPDGLENVLTSVKGFAKGRTIALFGCGGDRDKTKRPKMGKIAAEIADFVVVTTDNPRTEKPGDIIADILPGMQDSDTPHVVVEDRIEAIHWAMDHAEPGDVIVLCGKGHETYQEVNHVKHHMDEREIVADYLNAKA